MSLAAWPSVLEAPTRLAFGIAKGSLDNGRSDYLRRLDRRLVQRIVMGVCGEKHNWLGFMNSKAVRKLVRSHPSWPNALHAIFRHAWEKLSLGSGSHGLANSSSEAFPC